MSATPNSLFRHYLDSLIQQGTTRASLTDEARNVLRTWYVAARQGGRPAASASASPKPPPLQTSAPAPAPAEMPEPPELLPQSGNRPPPSPSRKGLWKTSCNTSAIWRKTGNRRGNSTPCGTPWSLPRAIPIRNSCSSEAPGYYEEVQQEPFRGPCRGKTQPDIKGYGALQRHGLISTSSNPARPCPTSGPITAPHAGRN